jgi:DnaJ-class molecular chaperone
MAAEPKCPDCGGTGWVLVFTSTDMLSGETRLLDVPLQMACLRCRAPKLPLKEEEIDCLACQGTGEVRLTMDHLLGPLPQIQEDCPVCNGTGKVPVKPTR